MSAFIEQVEYHIIDGGSQFDEVVDWFAEHEKEEAVAKAEELGGNHTVFKVTSYINDYEAIT